MKCCLLPPMNKAGYPVILIFVIISLGLSLFLHSFAFDIIALLLSIGVYYFFRDPVRVIARDDNHIVSPADGVITFINNDAQPPQELGMEGGGFTQISIFLSIMNVHVNRTPVACTIKNSVYTAGAFKNMLYSNRNDRAENYERQALALEDSHGNNMAVVQIAGFVARRIICNANIGGVFRKGERFGIICFGSRVDLYLPANFVLNVNAGQTVVGGETVIALYKGKKNDQGFDLI